MKNLFWRQSTKDDRRWFGTFRAETDGYKTRYEFVPSIRGVAAGIIGATIAVAVVYGVLNVVSAAYIVIDTFVGDVM